MIHSSAYITLRLTVLSLLLLFAASCRTETNDPLGPGPTSEQAELGAYINGGLWIAQNLDAQSLPSITATLDRNDLLEIKAYRTQNGNTDVMTIRLKQPRVGEFELHNQFDNIDQTAEFEDGRTGERYYITDQDGGFVTVTKWDPATRTVEGEFDFRARSNGMVPIEVAQGLFRNVRFQML